jgi:ATP synthase protein I
MSDHGDGKDKENSGHARQQRIRRSHEERKKRFWYDFVRFNLTGWSVVLPTMAGLAFGAWIDNRWQSPFSWKLALMLVGLVLGCLNAWYWIRKKDREQ